MKTNLLTKIAQGYGRYFDQLQDMFARIGDNLPRFRILQQLFPQHERLLASLSDAYLDVIAFCVEAKELFAKARKASGKRPLRPNSSGFLTR
jgi:hypothetical protein